MWYDYREKPQPRHYPEGVEFMKFFNIAKPIYLKDRSLELNVQAGFVCPIEAQTAGDWTLTLAGSTLYRVYLDGEVVHYGPARGPRGFVRCDCVTLSMEAGAHMLAIEVAGYNLPSFYTMLVPSFLQAELSFGGEVKYYTGRDFKALSLTSLREQKVLRYSFQRAFTEVWRMGSPVADWKSGAFEGEVLSEVDHGCEYLSRDFAIPYMGMAPDARPMESGRFTLRTAVDRSSCRFLHAGPETVCFELNELADNVLDSTDADFTADPAITDTLSAGQYTISAFDHIYSGFVRTKLTVTEPATVYVIFAEQFMNGRLMYGNGLDAAWVNIIKYELPKGSYQLESFEVYSLMYAGVMVESGKVTVESIGLREYAYPAERIKAPTDDPMLNAVMDAAYAAFRQNTIDCFMDCPGRERGGWLCDSYFTGKAAKLFTGSSECERAYLDDFRLPKDFPDLPDGLLPMCYPAGGAHKNTIPQWTMWYVVELGGFKERGGDTAPFREVVTRIYNFFASYENSDGLLEKLPYWNFVEWAKAYSWVQDVNYPTNMLYYRMLYVMADILDRPELCDKAEHVKAEILRQAFDGEYFQDHAKRDAEGKLVLCGDYSAICQHEAALFGIADLNDPKFAVMRDCIVNGCGPDPDPTHCRAGLEPLNLFIGLMVRGELLCKLGLYEQNLSEIKVLFGERMAVETGTLWEHRLGDHSRNHGLGSAVACTILECLEHINQ